MAAVVFGTAVSCRKDDEPVDDHSDHDHVHSSLSLHVNHKFGASDFTLNTAYDLGNGKSVKISRIEYYLSQPHARTMEDSIIDNYADKYVLVQPGTMHYELGEADFEHDHMHRLTFNIGVDSLANHTDPTTYDASHALSPKVPSMHWAWSSGYRFIVIEGEIDQDNDGTFDDSFLYHIGMDAFLVENTLHVHKNITTAGVMIEMNADYSVLFEGLDLATDLSTHTMDNMPLSNKIKANLPNMITYQE